MFQKLTFCLICLVAFVNVSIGQDGVQFTNEKWKDILALSQSEDKLIFIDAYTTWCGPCKKMARDIFPLHNVGKFYNKNFVNVKMDMERGEGVALAEQYEVVLYPTLLFVDSKGKIVHRAVGYHNEAEFLSIAKDALNPAKSLAGMSASYEKGNRDADFLYKYTVSKFEARADYSKIADEYLTTQSDWKTNDNMQFIYSFVTDSDSKMFDYLLENKQSFGEKFGEVQIAKKIEEVVMNRLNNEQNKPELSDVDALFAKVMGDRAAQNSSSYRMTYYRQKGERANYAKSAIAHFKKYKKVLTHDEINETAWTFYEVIDDKKLLKKATKMSKKSIKMANNYYNNDTLAALYSKLGKKSKALKQANKAVAIAQANKEDHSATDNLIEEIKAM